MSLINQEFAKDVGKYLSQKAIGKNIIIENAVIVLKQPAIANNVRARTNAHSAEGKWIFQKVFIVIKQHLVTALNVEYIFTIDTSRKRKKKVKFSNSSTHFWMKGRSKLVTLKAVCGPSDNLEPVITVMKPNED